MTKLLSVNEIVAYENINWREQGAHKYVHASDYAALEAQDEVHWKTRRTLLTRIAALEARCREQQEHMDKIRDAALEWAMTCPCICAECDRFYESIKANAGSEKETKGDIDGR